MKVKENVKRICCRGTAFDTLRNLMVLSVTTYLTLPHKLVSGLVSAVFLCKSSVKMAATLSNCTTQTVVGVVRLKCLKFIREC
jgi:hypothetical protein